MESLYTNLLHLADELSIVGVTFERVFVSFWECAVMAHHAGELEEKGRIAEVVKTVFPHLSKGSTAVYASNMKAWLSHPGATPKNAYELVNKKPAGWASKSKAGRPKGQGAGKKAVAFEASAGVTAESLIERVRSIRADLPKVTASMAVMELCDAFLTEFKAAIAADKIIGDTDTDTDTDTNE